MNPTTLDAPILAGQKGSSPTATLPAAHLNLFTQAADIMDNLLSISTNLSVLERKTVTYWTLATHALPTLQKYPLLALFGPLNTGKSAILKVTARFAFKPVEAKLSGLTDAVLRDALAKTCEGTIILEEGDRAKAATDAIEQQLSDRYGRDTSRSVVNKAKDKSAVWNKEAINIFGATVIHRRSDFVDAALASRTITLTTCPNHKREYADLTVEFTEEGKGLLDGVKINSLPKVDVPRGVGKRVVSNYAPLLGVARLLGDEDFIQDIINESLHHAQAELEQAQQSEPTILILQGIVGYLIDPEIVREGKYIKLAVIRERILQETGREFDSRQIGATARRMKLTVTTSHGQAVVDPQPAALLRACEAYGYQGEEDMEALRLLIKG